MIYLIFDWCFYASNTMQWYLFVFGGYFHHKTLIGDWWLVIWDYSLLPRWASSVFTFTSFGICSSKSLTSSASAKSSKVTLSWIGSGFLAASYLIYIFFNSFCKVDLAQVEELDSVVFASRVDLVAAFFFQFLWRLLLVIWMMLWQ